MRRKQLKKTQHRSEVSRKLSRLVILICLRSKFKRGTREKHDHVSFRSETNVFRSNFKSNQFKNSDSYEQDLGENMSKKV